MSNLLKTAFVIAHFHTNGRVALNTHALIKEMAKLSDNIIFVSTNLNDTEVIKLQKFAKVIIRKNFGYDFWSYKLGIDQLGDLNQFDRVVICNTSIIVLDPSFLVTSFTGPVNEIGLLGLSRNGEMGDHIQSYWISFEGSKLLKSHEFSEWWSTLLPLDDRTDNINKYEVGLSTYFSSFGYKLKSLFQATENQLLIMLARAIGAGLIVLDFKGKIDLEKNLTMASFDITTALTLNPTAFGWDFLLDTVKIIKIEQIKFNPGKQYMDSKISTLSYEKILLINDAVL